MMATMFVGLGSASAVGVSFTTLAGAPAVTGGNTNNLGTLVATVDAGSLSASSVINLKLPADFEFDSTITVTGNIASVPAATTPGTVIYIPEQWDGDNTNALWNPSTATTPDHVGHIQASLEQDDSMLRITFDNPADPYAILPNFKAYFLVYMRGVNVPAGTNGDIKITSVGNAATGELVVARGADGEVTLAVDRTNTFSETTRDIRITVTENMAGGFQDGTIRLRLPAGFAWNIPGGAASIWGFNSEFGTQGWADALLAVIEDQNDGRYLAITNDDNGTTAAGVPTASGARSSASFTIRVTVDDPDAAKYGEVNATITTRGDIGVTNTGSLLLGTYGDYGIKVSAESVPDVYSGQVEQVIGDIIVEESAPDSLIANRTISFTLPSNAKWARVGEVEGTRGLTAGLFGGTGVNGGWVGRDGRILRYEINHGTNVDAGRLSFEDFEIIIAPGTSGDISVEVGGSAGVKGEVVVAKAVQAISVTSQAADVKLGVQNQAASDIVITEAADGILYGGQDLEIFLPHGGIRFAAKPTVSVTDGDLVLNANNVNITDSGRILVIPIRTESSVASTITISDITYTVDRTHPEGAAVAHFQGDALIAIHDTDAVRVSSNLDEYYTNAGGNGNDLFDDGFVRATTYDVEAEIANCITPAPSDQSGVTVFTIGSTTYTFNGVSATMDVAPYIKNSRTYMPIRYVAYAVGISDQNIIWNEADQTVTLIRDNIVAQLKIGQQQLVINGATVTMDVAPEIVNSRTMLPASWVANAFGATAAWDADTQNVTITK
jgi:hypothetical protein